MGPDDKNMSREERRQKRILDRRAKREAEIAESESKSTGGKNEDDILRLLAEYRKLMANMMGRGSEFKKIMEQMMKLRMVLSKCWYEQQRALDEHAKQIRESDAEVSKDQREKREEEQEKREEEEEEKDFREMAERFDEETKQLEESEEDLYEIDDELEDDLAEEKRVKAEMELQNRLAREAEKEAGLAEKQEENLAPVPGVVPKPVPGHPEQVKQEGEEELLRARQGLEATAPGMTPRPTPQSEVKKEGPEQQQRRMAEEAARKKKEGEEQVARREDQSKKDFSQAAANLQVQRVAIQQQQSQQQQQQAAAKKAHPGPVSKIVNKKSIAMAALAAATTRSQGLSGQIGQLQQKGEQIRSQIRDLMGRGIRMESGFKNFMQKLTAALNQPLQAAFGAAADQVGFGGVPSQSASSGFGFGTQSLASTPSSEKRPDDSLTSPLRPRFKPVPK